MAVLDREKFFNTLHERIGTDTSEEALTFIEDMTDTYNDLSDRLAGDGVDWKSKYNELDKSWKEKYRHRFFHSGGGNPSYPEQEKDENEYNPEGITFDSLFK